MRDTRPIIGITMGDPFGVGPEIAVKSLSDKNVYSLCKPFLIGVAGVFREAVSLVGLKLKIISIRSVAENYSSKVVRRRKLYSVLSVIYGSMPRQNMRLESCKCA